jgi:hypothetical protein
MLKKSLEKYEEVEGKPYHTATASSIYTPSTSLPPTSISASVSTSSVPTSTSTTSSASIRGATSSKSSSSVSVSASVNVVENFHDLFFPKEDYFLLKSGFLIQGSTVTAKEEEAPVGVVEIDEEEKGFVRIPIALEDDDEEDEEEEEEEEIEIKINAGSTAPSSHEQQPEEEEEFVRIPILTDDDEEEVETKEQESKSQNPAATAKDKEFIRIPIAEEDEEEEDISAVPLLPPSNEDQAITLKERGDELVKKGLYNDAVTAYSQSLELSFKVNTLNNRCQAKLSNKVRYDSFFFLSFFVSFFLSFFVEL